MGAFCCLQTSKQVILDNNQICGLYNDTNFVSKTQVFSCFLGNGSEKCPLLMEGGCMRQQHKPNIIEFYASIQIYKNHPAKIACKSPILMKMEINLYLCKL